MDDEQTRWARHLRPTDLSFLAPPGELADWRLVLAYGAAAEAGVLDALPGRVAELATRCELDEQALRPLLGQLAAWGVVGQDGDDRYVAGPHAVGWPDSAKLVRHAAVIQRWATLLGPRLRDRNGTGDLASGVVEADLSGGAEHASRARLALDLLAVHQRRLVGPVVDSCLRGFPHAVRVLDLGGGHGEHALEFSRRGLTVTMQDLPHVIEDAERRDELRGAGITLYAGDLHETLPPGPFDLVLLSAVTNMFGESRNRELFRRLRPIISPGGGLAIVSYMRDRDVTAATFGLQMLVSTDEGDAHEQDSYRRWLGDAAFTVTHVHQFADPPQTVLLAAVE